MELEYTKVGDYYLPNLLPPEDIRVGRFGRLYLQRLRKNKDHLYTGMLLKGTLKKHVETIDRDAEDLYETIIQNMAKEHGITEELKASDQMAWVGVMNNIRNAAEEIVWKEVYELV